MTFCNKILRLKIVFPQTKNVPKFVNTYISLDYYIIRHNFIYSWNSSHNLLVFINLSKYDTTMTSSTITGQLAGFLFYFFESAVSKVFIDCFCFQMISGNQVLYFVLNVLYVFQTWFLRDTITRYHQLCHFPFSLLFLKHLGIKMIIIKRWIWSNFWVSWKLNFNSPSCGKYWESEHRKRIENPSLGLIFQSVCPHLEPS